MNENRRRILGMLAEGKVSAEEADRLLTLVDSPAKDAPQEASTSQSLVELGERHVSVDVHRQVEGIEEDVRESIQNQIEGVRDSIQVEVERHLESRDEDEDEHDDDIEGNGKRRTENKENSFNVGPSPKLVVVNFNGPIEIEAGSDDAIQVKARLKGADNIDYETRCDGETVFVTARKKGGLTFRFNRVGASISIVAPVSTEIDLTTSNGAIVVNGIEGSGPVITSNGKIILEKVKGDHEVITSNGRIDIAEMEGNATLNTSNGRISLQDVKGAFSAVTNNGVISFNGELTDGKHLFETTNGSVKIRLSGTPNFKLDARTSNGSIKNELHLQDISSSDRKHLAGTVGDGQGELVVRTTNGSVSIE